MVIVRAYLASLVAFLAVDAVWLLLVAAPLFAARLGDWLRPAPDLSAAAAFYLIYAAGLTGLAVLPTRRQASLAAAAAKGALLGLTAYATFDLTALAILQRYTLDLALADIAWGTAASSVAALAGVFAAGQERETAS